MASQNDKKGTTVTVQTRKGSDDSVSDTLKSPRLARFAEATSVNSPIEPSETSRNFDSPIHASYRPQPQPGDVGFGYINDRRSVQEMPHVEMPASPKSPLKSAMRLPGTGPRNLDNAMKSPTFAPSLMMSPTWREEKLLERKTTLNDREQQRDLVSCLAPKPNRCFARRGLNGIAESQDPCENGEDGSPLHQLLLQSHRPGHALDHAHRLQCHRQPPRPQHPAPMGTQHPDMAAKDNACHCLRLALLLRRHPPGLLQGRTSASGEIAGLLHNHGRRLVRREHRHLGSQRRPPPARQEYGSRQRSLGLELQGQCSCKGVWG